MGPARNQQWRKLATRYSVIFVVPRWFQINLSIQKSVQCCLLWHGHLFQKFKANIVVFVDFMFSNIVKVKFVLIELIYCWRSFLLHLRVPRLLQWWLLNHYCPGTFGWPNLLSSLRSVKQVFSCLVPLSLSLHTSLLVQYLSRDWAYFNYINLIIIKKRQITYFKSMLSS